MRWLFGFVCAFTLGAVGCNETARTGGSECDNGGWCLLGRCQPFVGREGAHTDEALEEW